MKLVLENGFEFEMPEEKKYNIFYGPNKIGKTQISIGLKKYYEKLNENVLLFNENIIRDMIIQDIDDNDSFEIMPRIQEYNKYKNEYEKSKKDLSVKENIKNICSKSTKTTFSDFKKISEYLSEDAYFYKGDILKPNYTEEELKYLFKAKPGLYNFFEIVDSIINGNIKTIPQDIKSLVSYEIYSLQSDIIYNKEKYKFCPVCYSEITLESMEKIRKSIENGSMDEKLKNSILYYLDSKYEKILNLINNLLICESYITFKKDVILEVENALIYYLNDLYDSKNIDIFLNSKQQLEKILKETKDFKISENKETYEYIKNKFKQHSAYKNVNIDIEIKNGKLKIINSGIEYSKMSKSEQNFFKFLYFDVLVYQKKQDKKLHIIVDDPFDSYDDIYVHDSIGIIVNLVNECINNIETINIFSHSMYIIYLYENISSLFTIYWLDQIKYKKEILIYSDKYQLLSNIEKNPYEYGLILKISNNYVDKYSLIAFATLLRNEINMEKLLMKKSLNCDIKKIYKKVESLYKTVSNSINHIKIDTKVTEIAKKINEIFYYDLLDINNENIDDVMQDITSTIDSIDIKIKDNSNDISIVNKNDIAHILILKILLGLKIRRIFEKKARDIVKSSYSEIGDLAKKLENGPLKDFYNTYRYVLNSFNHSSSRLVPPIFVYSINTLQDIYDELVTI